MTVMFERYSESARRTLFFTRYELSVLGGTTIEPEHLLLGLLRDSTGAIKQLLADSKVPLTELRHHIEQRLARGPRMASSVEIPFADATQRILKVAVQEADRIPHQYVEPRHLLLALLQEKDSLAFAILTSHGITLDAAREYLATQAIPETNEEVARAADPIALAHIERVQQLARELAQAEPNSGDARDLVARIDEELLMLQLLLS